MHPSLLELIQAFRGAQDLAVSTLRDRLGVRLPQSNLEWAKTCYSMGLEELGRGIGVGIRPHGYGVELRFPGISIDFDWGDKGEAYGFDVWRLWRHCLANQLFQYSMTYDLVEARFKKACAASELVGDRLLHYLPEERRRFRPANEACGSRSGWIFTIR